MPSSRVECRDLVETRLTIFSFGVRDILVSLQLENVHSNSGDQRNAGNVGPWGLGFATRLPVGIVAHMKIEPPPLLHFTFKSMIESTTPCPEAEMAPDSCDHTRNISVVDRFLHLYFYQWLLLYWRVSLLGLLLLFPLCICEFSLVQEYVSSSVFVIFVSGLYSRDLLFEAFHLYMSLVKDGVLWPVHLLVTWYFIRSSSFVERLLKEEHFILTERFVIYPFSVIHFLVIELCPLSVSLPVSLLFNYYIYSHIWCTSIQECSVPSKMPYLGEESTPSILNGSLRIK